MKKLLVVVVLSLAVPCLAFGQAQPPKPGPEVQKLADFVGTWKSDGELKAGPWGPAGKISGTSTCEWFAGGFHVVCRVESTGPMGKMTELEIVGYDAESKVYTYYGINSLGGSDSATGSLAGNTWTWVWDGKADGKPARYRITEMHVSPTSYTVKFEYSVTGGPWIVFGESKDTKVK